MPLYMCAESTCKVPFKTFEDIVDNIILSHPDIEFAYYKHIDNNEYQRKVIPACHQHSNARFLVSCFGDAGVIFIDKQNQLRMNFNN